MVTWIGFVQGILNGFLIGGIYALCAVGLNMIMGVMRVINFAQGEFLMIGMYISYWLFAIYGIDPYISAILSFLSLFLLGMLIQRTLVNPILKSPTSHQMLLTFGISLILQNIALLFWQSNFRVANTGYSRLVYQISIVQVSFPRVIAFISAVSFTLVLYVFLKKSRLGKALRATAQNSGAATLMGIDIGRIHLFAFGIAAAMGGIAGSLVTPFYSVSPTVGSNFTLMTLVIVVLGGLGSFEGAFFGGLIMGVVETIASILLPAQLKSVVALSIFILLLLVRPSGLFGKTRE